MDLLLIIKLIILGAIQGFTEPLPISSSGHMILAGDFFDVSFDEPLYFNFLIIANFGSLIAVIIYYWKDIYELADGSIKYIFKKDKSSFDYFRYVLYVIVATIPASIFGLLFKDQIEDNLSNTLTVGIALLFTGLALLIINKAPKLNDKENVNIIDSIIIGLAQIIALIPGISRSGSTVVAGLSQKLTIEAALKFSFMMYIPISIAAFVFSLSDFSDNYDIPYLGYFLGVVAATITTYFAISFFINVVKKGKLVYFSIYCFIVGLIAIILS